MQGESRAGKKDDVQRKQRNAFRPHGSQTKSYQSAWPQVMNPGTGRFLIGPLLGSVNCFRVPVTRDQSEVNSAVTDSRPTSQNRTSGSLRGICIYPLLIPDPV